jgi:disease resistance protein RPM1
MLIYTNDFDICSDMEEERHFQIRIWLVISKEYQLIDVLKKILQKLWGTDANIPQTDPEYFIIKIYNSLKEKRYLIVLDDVWSTDLWTGLKVALPEDNNKSRVLITTRFKL